MIVQDSANLDGLSETFVQAHRQLEKAKQFLQNGKYEQTLDACRELLGKHAGHVGAFYTLGQAYAASKDLDSALMCFIRVSMLSPHDPSIFAQLAQVYFDLGADEAAIQTAREALSLQPEDALAGKAHLLLGQAYERRGDYEKAAENLELAQDLNPELNDAALLLGQCQLELGEQDKSAIAYKSALEGDISPAKRARAIYDLAGHTDSATELDLLAQIAELSDETPRLDNAKERAIFIARLELAKAAILENQGNHAAAWEALIAGNERMREVTAADRERSRKQDKFTFERVAQWNFAGAAARPFGYSPPLSLFILGPSQAGKTILERLLGTVEGMRAGHQSDIVHAVVARTCNSTGLMTLQFPGQLPRQTHEAFTKFYIDELNARAPDAKLFTVTHSDLITDLGRIAELVPNMRAIILDRAVDETALRIFAKVYAADASCFAYDVPGIYEYLEGFGKLSDAWTERLPGMIMRVDYDDMICDPKGVLTKIAEFCSLPAPKGKLPKLGDDRECAKPYIEFLNTARG